MMFLSTDGSTRAARSAVAAYTTRTDCGRLVQDREMRGGNAGNTGNPESLGKQGPFRRWRQAAQTGGNWRKLACTVLARH
jgi:hypothetical protein